MPIYLKYGDINGESTAPGYIKWIELDSWSWGATAEPDSEAMVQHFNFVSAVGPHSALLLGALLNRQIASTGALAVLKPNPSAKEATVEVKMNFSNLELVVYDVGEVGTAPVQEQVSFAFEKVTFITGNNQATTPLPG